MGNYNIDVLKDENGDVIRPATITDNVVNPTTRKTVTEEVNDLAYKIKNAEFNITGFLPNGNIEAREGFLSTDFVSVKTGDIIVYSGNMGGSYANVWAYNENRNPISVVLPNGTYNKESVTITDNNIKYVRACVKVATSPEILLNVLSDKLKSIDNEILVLNKQVKDLEDAPSESVNLPLTQKGVLHSDGSVSENDNFSYTEVVVLGGDTIKYTGYTGNPSYFSSIVGFDDDGIPHILLDGAGSTTIEDSFVVIPDNIKKVIVCAANSSHASFRKCDVRVIPQYRNYIGDVSDNGVNIEFPNTGFLLSDGKADARSGFKYTDFIDVNGKLFVYSGYIGAAYTCVAGYPSRNENDAVILLQGGTYSNKILSIPSNVKYIRACAKIEGTDVPYALIEKDLSKTSYNERLSAIEKKLDKSTSTEHCLKGKKIAIIGDSISTIEGGNAPYIKIGANDVGNTIESYITWWDVWNDANGTSAKNKTIGGVSITSAMIGTKRSFTPNASDVGKMLGEAANYNSASTLVWSKQLSDMTGCEIVSNTSWSGSSMCSGQSGSYALSHAWSDYTLGRLKQRDSNGNIITPDVIFIYRGTNDMTHIQGAGGTYSVIDDYDISANGYPNTDVNDSGKYSFTRAYIMTIKKLRDEFPNAIIYCCTLNVFKRIIYDRFPTRNGLYSLPQINDKIREIANTMGCGLVELDKDGITFENCYPKYISDSANTPTHPNSTGHEMMAKRAFADTRFAM